MTALTPISYMIAALASLTPALGASAAARPADDPRGELVWGFSEYEPFKYVESGEHKGIDVLLMREVARRMGLTLRIVDCPLKRCLSLMESGQIDVVTALGMRPEREAYIDYVKPPYNTENAKRFYVRKGSGVRIDKWEDIYAHVIGVKNGAGYSTRFDSDPAIRKDAVDDVRQNLRKLAQGRVDVVINTEIQFDFLAVKLGLDGHFERTSFSVETGEDYIGLSKRSRLRPRRAEMEAVVRELVESGRMRRIVDEFFAMVRTEMESVSLSDEAPVARPRNPRPHPAPR